MSQPTRTQVIAEIVMAAVTSTRITWQAYVDAVVAHYHAQVALSDRVLRFREATVPGEVDEVARLNTQTVKRMLIGEHKLVADIEDALISALPPEWRVRLLTALLDRQGLLLANKPAAPDDVAGQVRSAAALMRKTANAVQAIAPILEDGVIDAEDAPHFAPAIEALGRLMGACVTLHTQFTHALTRVAPAAQRH